MKINMAYPKNGSLKTIEIIEQRDWAKLIDMRLGQEFDGSLLNPSYAGYIFKISGGSDKDGFGMKQGVMTKNKLKLLLAPGSSGYKAKREGVSKRKTVRGCIIGLETASINLVVLHKGEKEIEGLTDTVIPRRLGPKRANKIRKLFNYPKHSDNIGKKDSTKIDVDPQDVRRIVVRRQTKTVGDKTYYKAPKIQRLITDDRLRRKKNRLAMKYSKAKINANKIAEFKKKNAEKRHSKKSNQQTGIITKSK